MRESEKETKEEKKGTESGKENRREAVEDLEKGGKKEEGKYERGGELSKVV